MAVYCFSGLFCRKISYEHIGITKPLLMSKPPAKLRLWMIRTSAYYAAIFSSPNVFSLHLENAIFALHLWPTRRSAMSPDFLTRFMKGVILFLTLIG